MRRVLLSIIFMAFASEFLYIDAQDQKVNFDSLDVAHVDLINKKLINVTNLLLSLNAAKEVKIDISGLSITLRDQELFKTLCIASYKITEVYHAEPEVPEDQFMNINVICIICAKDADENKILEFITSEVFRYRNNKK